MSARPVCLKCHSMELAAREAIVELDRMKGQTSVEISALKERIAHLEKGAWVVENAEEYRTRFAAYEAQVQRLAAALDEARSQLRTSEKNGATRHEKPNPEPERPE